MAKLTKQQKLDRMEEYIRDYVPCFTPCMGTETTERWIEIFGKKMGERRLDEDNIDAIEQKLGFVFNEKDKKDFSNLWKNIFKEVMLDYIKRLKKFHTNSIQSPQKMKKKTFLIAILTGLVEVIGVILGYYTATISDTILPFALSFAGGTMLYVISDEMIPETHAHGNERAATYALLIGFAVMLIFDFILG